MFVSYRYENTKSKINRKTKVENNQHDTKNNRVGGSPSPNKDTLQNYTNQSRNWGNIST